MKKEFYIIFAIVLTVLVAAFVLQVATHIIFDQLGLNKIIAFIISIIIDVLFVKFWLDRLFNQKKTNQVRVKPSAQIENTLLNLNWLRKNEAKILEILPQTWTHIDNLDPVKLGYQFKVIGIDWRSNEELTAVLCLLEKIGITLRDGYTIRANPHSVFKRSYGSNNRNIPKLAAIPKK